MKNSTLRCICTYLFIICMCSCSYHNHCIWNAETCDFYDGSTAYLIHKTAIANADYLNKDGSKAAYLVDSLYLNLEKYTLVQSESNRHIFLLPDSIFKNKRMLTLKYILNSPECYIVHKNMWFIRDFGEDRLTPPIFTESFQGSKSNGSFQTVRYEYPPKYFRLYLIRGDVFNNGICHIQPHLFIPIDFPNDKHFYKLLTPVWDEEGIAEAERLRKLKPSVNDNNNNNKIRLE